MKSMRVGHLSIFSFRKNVNLVEVVCWASRFALYIFFFKKWFSAIKINKHSSRKRKVKFYTSFEIKLWKMIWKIKYINNYWSFIFCNLKLKGLFLTTIFCIGVKILRKEKIDHSLNFDGEFQKNNFTLT